jgi:hypothetical protein
MEAWEFSHASFFGLRASIERDFYLSTVLTRKSSLHPSEEDKKLSDALDGKQKKRYITNLLQEMKKDGHIFPDGTTRWAKWRISKPKAKGNV